MSPTPHTGPFNLEQTGIDVQLVPTLTSPYALGLWLAEQPAQTQALMLAGWLQGLEEPQATAMLRMVTVGRELRDVAAPLSGACAALEHLLHATRGQVSELPPDRSWVATEQVREGPRSPKAAQHA